MAIITSLDKRGADIHHRHYYFVQNNLIQQQYFAAGTCTSEHELYRYLVPRITGSLLLVYFPRQGSRNGAKVCS